MAAVTGANSGIGLETARVRSKVKGQRSKLKGKRSKGGLEEMTCPGPYLTCTAIFDFFSEQFRVRTKMIKNGRIVIKFTSLNLIPNNFEYLLYC